MLTDESGNISGVHSYFASSELINEYKDPEIRYAQGMMMNNYGKRRKRQETNRKDIELPDEPASSPSSSPRKRKKKN